MNAIPTNVIRWGTASLRPAPLILQAGQFTARFEPDTGFLRSIRLGDHEVVRAIYAAVRDQSWNTIPANISNLQVQSGENSFRISFDVECRQNQIDYLWKGEIQGEEPGRITFRFDGEARSTFLRNRIGICVLHPILECAGKLCVVERVDGTSEDGVFPRFISPHQPFRQIRAITHEIVSGVRAEVRFAGEIFEMEDQRNWTDASFKTYSTPLDLPRPVEVVKGERVEQSVAVSLIGAGQKRILPIVQGRTPQLSIATTPILPKPGIGLGRASHGQPLSAREIERLKRLRLSHLRVDLKLGEPDYAETLRQALAEAGQLGLSLHVALFLSSKAEEELAALVEELKAAGPKVSLWLVFNHPVKVTDTKLIRLAHQYLSAFGSNILIAAGTNSHFVELNRQRPTAEFRALPCYSITPQVHAFDHSTLIENLAGQAATVESGRQIWPHSPVISPITLRPRFNADAAGAEVAASKTLPNSVDPRQMSLFGAAWTLGSLARLLTAGEVHSLTYFETTGWRGIMETENGSPLPEQFPSQPGIVFPIYHVFAELAEFDRVCPTFSSHPLQVEGLTLLDAKDRRRVLVANFLGELQEIKIKTGACQARIRYLDERNAMQTMTDPESFRVQPGELQESVSGKVTLQMLPCGLACVDLD